MVTPPKMFLITEDHSIFLKKQKNEIKLLLQSKINGKWQESASVPFLTLKDGLSIWTKETQVSPIENSQVLFRLRNHRNNEFEVTSEIDTQPDFHPWIHF